ncbi:hypothetical protein [Streptomyces olivaceus]|uniref:hypothetical protein n=1 Tax=Streptomyces olivaceus TaxID=47716 RepID=UPI001CD0315C|nr:hypothetical protein [Streptomyces olivaceus]MBZ6226896.1 hypothetical protein [Streptomyces olivaceus]
MDPGDHRVQADAPDAGRAVRDADHAGQGVRECVERPPHRHPGDRRREQLAPYASRIRQTP